MSDFGQRRVAPSTVTAGSTPEGGGPNRSRLLLAGGALAAVVLAGAVLLLSRPESPNTDFDEIGGNLPQLTASASATATSTPRRTLKAIKKDPFLPLVTPSASASVPPVEVPVPSSDASFDPLPTDDPTGTGQEATPTGAASPQLVQFEMVDVAANDKSAQVKVNGEPLTVKPFVPIFDAILPLKFADGTCGWFMTGTEDEEPVQICEGEKQFFVLTG